MNANLIRIFASGHFKQTHAKSVNIDALIILLGVHLWSHELRRTNDTLGKRALFERSQAQVTDLHLSRLASHEQVVALEIAMDDGRRSRVQVGQALQDLRGEVLNHLEPFRFVLLLEPLHVRF